ncbi:unnamed protein product [Arctia plantaginis]|uniref:Uncharacterized protein n=1 Tax=Arctia plantaginis TaxID=874455 RepID=A0A8S0YT47_ARCPL|nr:unnamed protein product [Arctia plantaginis]
MRTYTRRRPEHQLIDNVHELCRLCLCKAEGVVPIFTEEADNVCAVLALRIMICVGLEIKNEDCLPNIICTDCLNNLNKCYAFRKKCEVSYQKLKSHVLAVKETEFKKEFQRQNEAQNKNSTDKAESEEDMKFVVTFDKNQLAEVSMLRFNGNSNVANSKNDLSNVTGADSIENTITIQASEELVQENEIQQPDITTFLTAVLLQLGMLTQQDNDELVLTEQSINSLDVETGDGSQVVFELVEEDEQEEVLEESIVMEHPLEPIEELNCSEQNDVVYKYTSDNAVTKPSAQSKKAKENKRNGAWCDECGKQLATRSALHRHRRIHSGEKPYACQHCGRTFGQKEVMMRHALIHEERRPHACSSCTKSFTQRAALAAHARAHAPPHARALALHRCSRCPKVFLYASGLSRHMMMHAGRVYVCGACKRQFRDKSSLLRHFKNANHAADTT